ncbi:hypothetical protein B0H65DRAFT_272177 [Neurospora tetraspora]|uniref:Uncharacterized protein n=1 Tax=Neurospora tetraspora TaxID=94610 RepID=A0AAE0JBE7_9PEZI|nr:hypothetical protein B0H65DRAFT_272177 [Neurospora tetraspora]
MKTIPVQNGTVRCLNVLSDTIETSTLASTRSSLGLSSKTSTIDKLRTSQPTTRNPAFHHLNPALHGPQPRTQPCTLWEGQRLATPNTSHPKGKCSGEPWLYDMRRKEHPLDARAQPRLLSVFGYLSWVLGSVSSCRNLDHYSINFHLNRSTPPVSSIQLRGNPFVITVAWSLRHLVHASTFSLVSWPSCPPSLLPSPIQTRGIPMRCIFRVLSYPNTLQVSSHLPCSIKQLKKHSIQLDCMIGPSLASACPPRECGSLAA